MTRMMMASLGVGPVVEVVTSVKRRRSWTPEEKRSMVAEDEQPEKSVMTAIIRKQ